MLKSQRLMQEAVQHHQAGRLAEAEALYRQVLTHEPNQPDALHLLGLIARRFGHADAAVDLIGRAVAIHPSAEYLRSHADALAACGRRDEALAALKRAIELKPQAADLQFLLANLFFEAGQLPLAVSSYQEALKLRPDYPEALNNLAHALTHLGQFTEAAQLCQRALQLQPDYSNALINLGNACQQLEEYDAAIAAYQRSIAVAPQNVEAYSNLAVVLKYVGRLDETIAAYDAAMQLQPEASTLDNKLATIHMMPSWDAAAIKRELDRYNDLFAAPLAQFILPHDNDRSPDRKLRIGYVSPDFRANVVAFNLLPLFENHDRNSFSIYGYANIPRADAITDRFRSLSDNWRNIRGVSDEHAAEIIRADKIDILVDLAVHTPGNRLQLFARKPVPIQVTFAGYPGSTGLRTIDYRLTDIYLDPPGQHDDFYSERSIRLPNCWWCFSPEFPPSPGTPGEGRGGGSSITNHKSQIAKPDSRPPNSSPEYQERGPEVNELPALQNGFITFGCLNAFIKVNDRVLGLWAEVLQSVARSKLLLLAPRGSARDRVLAKLGDRVLFVDRQPDRLQYFQTYQRIDIALDTFPYNGHTTSLDGLWMGVPLVTLVGQTVVGRAGLSQLTNLGLTELICETEDQFVQTAASLANDPAQLAELRRTLRQRMESSSLMNATQFARDIEAAYRQMWLEWLSR